MKVFKTDVNKISLHSIILQLQLTLGHSMFKEIISVYSDSLVLISNYSFLFENSSNGNSQEFQNIDLNAKIVKNNVQRLLNGKNAYESSNQDFYMLKIYINLPGKKATNDTIACSKLEQNNEEILTADGGHVFISLINVDFSTMHVQSNTFGLYPAEKTGIIIGKTIKGQIRDDSKSYYDNSFSFIISKTDYENPLNFVNKASPKYNLYIIAKKFNDIFVKRGNNCLAYIIDIY